MRKRNPNPRPLSLSLLVAFLASLLFSACHGNPSQAILADGGTEDASDNAGPWHPPTVPTAGSQDVPGRFGTAIGSPAVLVNSASLGAWTATTDGVNVAAGETVSVKLADSAGARLWQLSVVGTDERVVAPVITQASVITGSATFTAPAAGSPAGWALIVRSTIGVTALGNDSTGKTNPAYSTTFGLYLPTSNSYRVGAVNETIEGSAAYGWVSKFNPLLRANIATGSGVGTDRTLATTGLLQGGGNLSTDRTISVAPGSNGQVAVTAAGTPSWSFISNSNISTSAAIDLSKISQAGASSGQAITWNGTTWAPGSPTGSCAVADFAALRNILAAARVDNQLCTVGSPVSSWIFSAATGAGFVDDAATVIKPTDVLVGNNGRWYTAAPQAVVPTIAALRAAVAGKASVIHVQAYSTLGDQGGGNFEYDSSDTTTSDDSCIVIVAGTRRYKRLYSGPLHVTWCGADPTGVASSATAFTNAATVSKHILVPPGTFKLTGGWSVPFSGRIIELAGGALIKPDDTIVTDKSDVRWVGHAFGRNFNSDGASTWHPNVLYTGAGSKPVMQWAKAASADGASATGILIDCASISTTIGYLVGTAGFGSSGVQFGEFGTLDCPTGIRLRAAVEESSFHTPYLGWRAGSLGTGTLGIGVGDDAGYDGGITSTVIGDHGGTISGFTKGVQLGGSVGRVTTVSLGGSAEFVIETIRTTGAVGIDIYDAYVARVRGIHMELHGQLITGATNANPTQITTFQPHGITTGTTVKITNILGNTGANGSFVATSTGASTFTIPVNTSAGGAYTSGGLVSDMTHKGIVVGHAGTAPTGVSIAENYLAGTEYPIETVAFDQLTIYDNDYEVSGSGDASHLPYAVHNIGGGLRRTQGRIEGTRVGRGTFYGGDLSSTTGFLSADLDNKDANNETLATRSFDGTYEAPYLHNGVATNALTTGATFTISGATGNAVNPTVIQLNATTNKIRTGDNIHIAGMLGNTAANGDWAATYVDSTHISVPVAGNGAYTSGGTLTEFGSFTQLYGAHTVTMGDGYNPVFNQDDGVAFLINKKVTATAGSTSHVPLGIQMTGSVWNGSAAVGKTWALASVITAANPFAGYWDVEINGTSLFAHDSAGFWWPAGYGAYKWKHAAAAPVSGAYVVGDIVWNTAPAASGNVGWVNVSAGSPGTWEQFGSITSGGGSGFVPTTRTITTTAPLTGGGSLAADRTFAVSNATTGAVGVVQLAGDLNGTGTAAATPRVGRLTGVSNEVLDDASFFTFQNGATNPTISQVALTGNSGDIFSITGQPGNGTDKNGGPVVVSGGTKTGAGVDGSVTMKSGSTTILDATTSGVDLYKAFLTFQSGATNPTFGQLVNTGNSGDIFSILGQDGNGSNKNGGPVVVGGGAKTGAGADGSVTLKSGASTILDATTSGVDLYKAFMTFQSGATNPTISQTINTGNSGDILSLLGQNGDGSNKNGGPVVVGGGAKTGAGTDGSVTMKSGSSTILDVTTSGIDIYKAFVTFQSGATNPTITQLVNTGNNGDIMSFIGQAGNGTDKNGGPIIVKGGASTGAGTSGAAQLISGDTGVYVEAAAIGADTRNIVALAGASGLTATQMPSSTGNRVVFIWNADTNPSANPVGGGILYVDAGALKYRGTSGTVTTLGNPFWHADVEGMPANDNGIECEPWQRECAGWR